VQNTAFSTNKTLNFNGRLVNLDQPKVMGVLNITPDSFYEGSRLKDGVEILRKTEKFLSEGADFIDVGGYSSRPGADNISETEELNRTVTAVKLIVKHFPDLIISIDTYRATVARQAVEEGALMINDISGGALDPKMYETVAALNLPYVLMHMRGTPQNMAKQTHYDNLLKDLLDYFHPRIYKLRQSGVKDIIVDPGFGFAKTIAQNFEILNQLDVLKMLGVPILVGLSRKAMVWKTLEVKPEEALNGTTFLNTVALNKGADIIRVHDVKEAVEVIKLHKALIQTPVNIIDEHK
jgi:dihydropteroate synthase